MNMKNLPMMIGGCLIVTLAAVFSMGFYLFFQRPSAPSSLVVFLPHLLFGKGAILIFPVLFAVIHLALFGLKDPRVTPSNLMITLILILSTGVLTAWFYVASWKYKDVYVDSNTVYIWAAMNCGLAVATFLSYSTAAKSRKSWQLVLTHILLFTWIETYAFPWLGETL